MSHSRPITLLTLTLSLTLTLLFLTHAAHIQLSQSPFQDVSQYTEQYVKGLERPIFYRSPFHLDPASIKLNSDGTLSGSVATIVNAGHSKGLAVGNTGDTYMYTSPPLTPSLSSSTLVAYNYTLRIRDNVVLGDAIEQIKSISCAPETIRLIVDSSQLSEPLNSHWKRWQLSPQLSLDSVEPLLLPGTTLHVGAEWGCLTSDNLPTAVEARILDMHWLNPYVLELTILPGDISDIFDHFHVHYQTFNQSYVQEQYSAENGTVRIAYNHSKEAVLTQHNQHDSHTQASFLAVDHELHSEHHLLAPHSLPVTPLPTAEQFQSRIQHNLELCGIPTAAYAKQLQTIADTLHAEQVISHPVMEHASHEDQLTPVFLEIATEEGTHMIARHQQLYASVEPDMLNDFTMFLELSKHFEHLPVHHKVAHQHLSQANKAAKHRANLMANQHVQLLSPSKGQYYAANTYMMLLWKLHGEAAKQSEAFHMTSCELHAVSESEHETAAMATPCTVKGAHAELKLVNTPGKYYVNFHYINQGTSYVLRSHPFHIKNFQQIPKQIVSDVNHKIKEQKKAAFRAAQRHDNAMKQEVEHEHASKQRHEQQHESSSALAVRGSGHPCLGHGGRYSTDCEKGKDHKNSGLSDDFKGKFDMIEMDPLWEVKYKLDLGICIITPQVKICNWKASGGYKLKVHWDIHAAGISHKEDVKFPDIPTYTSSPSFLEIGVGAGDTTFKMKSSISILASDPIHYRAKIRKVEQDWQAIASYGQPGDVIAAVFIPQKPVDMKPYVDYDDWVRGQADAKYDLHMRATIAGKFMGGAAAASVYVGIHLLVEFKKQLGKEGHTSEIEGPMKYLKETCTFKHFVDMKMTWKISSVTFHGKHGAFGEKKKKDILTDKKWPLGGACYYTDNENLSYPVDWEMKEWGAEGKSSSPKPPDKDSDIQGGSPWFIQMQEEQKLALAPVRTRSQQRRTHRAIRIKPTRTRSA